ncbi:hypothetical protein D3C87_1668100 [compost metagenome]
MLANQSLYSGSDRLLARHIQRYAKSVLNIGVIGKSASRSNRLFELTRRIAYLLTGSSRRRKSFKVRHQ